MKKLFSIIWLRKALRINQNVAVLFVLIAVSALLVFHIISVKASGAADTVGVEAENGTLSGNVSIASDPTASNGQYVLFGANTTPTPTPTPIFTPTPTPTAIPTPTPTPQSGLILSNLVVSDAANAAKYSFQTNMQVGNTLYADRIYTIKTLPATFLGSQWIRPANNSKTWNAGATLISFSINQPATVFVAVDNRLKKLPWMDAAWTTNNLTMTDSETHVIKFTFYQKSFPAGVVNLGPNNGPTASDMYIVTVQ